LVKVPPPPRGNSPHGPRAPKWALKKTGQQKAKSKWPRDFIEPPNKKDVEKMGETQDGDSIFTGPPKEEILVIAQASTKSGD